MKPKRTIKIVNGKEQVFYLVPAIDYQKLKTKKVILENQIKRLRAANKKWHLSNIYFRRVINEKVIEIDAMIERINIEENERK